MRARIILRAQSEVAALGRPLKLIVRAHMLPVGTVVVWLIAAVVGYLSSRFRSPLLGFLICIVAPVLVAYALAWVLMSPLLHPDAEAQGGWDLVATIFWSCWAVPVSMATHFFFRWRNSPRRANAL